MAEMIGGRTVAELQRVMSRRELVEWAMYRVRKQDREQHNRRR